MKEQKITFEKTRCNTAVVYVHGKGGSESEANSFCKAFCGCDVLGMEYGAETPWEAQKEFSVEFLQLTQHYQKVYLVANSIGAYFSMMALPQEKICQAFFVSPIVDMQRLICDALKHCGASEEDLHRQGTIFDGNLLLSWQYLQWVRQNPVCWKVPTAVLYGEHDCLVPFDTVAAFANSHCATLTVMSGGEHWFHTKEQLAFVNDWMQQQLKA